jgi:outer membrane protein assembly factor BamB
MKSIILLLILISGIVSISTGSSLATVNDLPSIPDSLYHLGWVWPDTLPLLKGDLASDVSGNIYATDENGTVYSVSNDGKILWKYHENYAFASSPIVGDSLIYFCCNDKKGMIKSKELYALDFNGQFRWNFIGDKDFEGSIFVGPDNIVYIPVRGKYSTIGAFCVDKEGIASYFDWGEAFGNLWLLGINTDGFLDLWRPFNNMLYFVSPKGDSAISYNIPVRPHMLFGTRGIAEYMYYPNGAGLTITPGTDIKPIWDKGINLNFDEGINSVIISDSSKSAFMSTDKGIIYKLDLSSSSVIWRCEIGQQDGEIGGLMLAPGGALIAVASRGVVYAADYNGKLIWRHVLFDSGVLSNGIITPQNDIFYVQSGRLFKFTSDPAQSIPPREALPLPSTRDEAEKEITEYMLQYITHDFEQLSSFIEEDNMILNMPMLSAPPYSSIILTKAKKSDLESSSFLDADKRISSWVYFSGKLLQGVEAKEAIKRNKRKSDGSIVPWSINDYVFAIIKLNDDNTQAEVCLDNHCGSLCGHGLRISLQRSPSGKWWVIKSVGTWVS